jgi:hypothetical protein
MSEEIENAADEQAVRTQEKRNENQRKQEIEDVREILKTPHGVRFMRRLMVEGRIFHSSFTGNSHTFYNEGWRGLALKILGDVSEASPNKLSEVLTEKKDEVKK